MNKEIEKNYSNNDITVVWKPNMCIHSTKCWNSIEGLPEVFNPRNRPWVNIEGAETNRIVEQVKKCPSGALSFYYNNQPEIVDKQINEEVPSIDVLNNGPLKLKGDFVIKYKESEIIVKGNAALCRCGNSDKKPFCDGSHIKTNFND